LWREGISDEQFRQLADTRIAQLKEESKPFLGSLPTPTRIRVDEIADLKLSAFGKLSFFAQSDRQDFKVSLFQGKALREALAVAGFGHV
jgi:hypothetical protein